MKPRNAAVIRSSRRYLFLTIGALAWRFVLRAVNRRRQRTHGLDAAAGIRLDARQFPAGQGERSSRSLSMGLERATRRAMVDRRGRREVQDGQRKNRQSKCDVRREGHGLGRRFQPPDGRNMGISDWPAKDSRRPGNGQKTWRNFPLEFQLLRRF